MGAGYGLYISDLEAKAVVTRWRDHNPWCVQFWGRHDDNTGASYGLWGAALRALLNPRRVQSAGRISYIFLPEYLQGSLLCVLPSRRILTYRPPTMRWWLILTTMTMCRLHPASAVLARARPHQVMAGHAG